MPGSPEIRSQKGPWTPQTLQNPSWKKQATEYLVGATVPLAAGRQASVLDRPAALGFRAGDA